MNTPSANSGKRTPDVAKKRLLPGEQVSFQEDPRDDDATDEELNSRYAKGEIRIVTEQARYPLAGILQMLQAEIDGDRRYKLDPEYQRRHRWDRVRKSRLIESFLMNVPVPPVFLYERDLARFEVMDGRQRLTTLSEFYGDEFELCGLQHWRDLDGRTYSTLPSKVRDGIDRRYISSIILLKETARNEEEAARLKKLVFERLNSGGVKLGGQETRNAVYDGPLNRLCLRLSENEEYRRMWGIPLDSGNETSLSSDEEGHDSDVDREPDHSTRSGQRMFEQMDDVEMVLRFFAYRHIEEFKVGLNRITDFLDKFIVQGNLFPEDVLAQYETLFNSTISFLWAALGSDAFTSLDPSKSRPTKIVYDAVMYAASAPKVVEKRALLLRGKHILRSELEGMYTERSHLFSGRKTNFADAQSRNKHVGAAFLRAVEKAEAEEGNEG